MLRPALFLSLAGVLAAQSHPQWWTWASPQSTALVGIRWEALQGTSAAKLLEPELFGVGQFALPDLESIHHSRQVLLSAPPFLAIASGDFKSATLQAQAPQKGMRRIRFKGVEVWLGKEGVSIARLSDQLILVGARPTLEAVIEQSQTEEGRQYTPLLAHAAALAQQNLWIISSKTADPLADRFAPLETAANDPQPAPPIEVAKPAPPPPAKPPVSIVAVNGVATEAPPPPKPAESPKTPDPPKPVKRVIRISGLDDGPVEIAFPTPASPNAPVR